MKKIVVRVLGAALLWMVSALPAAADSFTIDSSSGCSNCYGLSWTLIINEVTGGYTFGGETYQYEAILQVGDDDDVTGTPTATISAVDFKVSSGITSATIYQAPTGYQNWPTSVDTLSGGAGAGCKESAADFVCSESAGAPAAFTGSTLTWAWYFDSTPLFDDLFGSHIGAKMVALNQPGKLLSEVYVPEPSSLALFALGSVVVGFGSRRKARRR